MLLFFFLPRPRGQGEVWKTRWKWLLFFCQVVINCYNQWAIRSGQVSITVFTLSSCTFYAPLLESSNRFSDRVDGDLIDCLRTLGHIHSSALHIFGNLVGAKATQVGKCELENPSYLCAMMDPRWPYTGFGKSSTLGCVIPRHGPSLALRVWG